MGKLLAVDIKRLLNNKKAIVFAIVAPLVLALLIAFAVAPFFFADVRAEDFTVAVFSEDDHPLTESILQGLIESESLGGLIEVVFVDGENEGMDAVRAGGAAAFIHVPHGMQDALRSGGSAQISYYGNPNMPLEDALLFETLRSGTALVSHAQHAVNVLYGGALDAGISKETAQQVYSNTMAVYFSQVLSRDALYEQAAQTSPLGGALPVEYYAACLLVLFAALGSLPISRITADDAQTGLVHRQLLSGHSSAACFFSRWLAGGLFICVQYAVLVASLVALTGGFAAFFGSVWSLLLGGVLLSLFVSASAMLIGLFARSSAMAVTLTFMCALALALLGGLFVPSAYMPAVVRDISLYTPFAASMRLSISGMFDADAGGLWTHVGTLAVYTVIGLPIALVRFVRRTL